MKSNTRLNPKTGFTLIELLVVIAIIGILAGLVMGGTSRAKMAAHRISCLNNLKQWGYAMRIYTEENDDKFPRESAMDGVNSWEMTAYATNQSVWYNVLPAALGIPTMAHYAQTPSSQQSFYNRGNLFHCPSARFSDVSATYPNFSLAINSKLMRDFESAPSSVVDMVESVLQMKQIRLPEKTALFLDCGVPGEDPITPFQTAFTGQPKAYASQFSGRHQGGGNILFVAGHAQTLPGPQVVDTDPNSVHRGTAIFPPQKVVWTANPSWVP